MTPLRNEEPRSIFYTCSYVPEEILLAAGFEPRRLLPAVRSGEALVHPNTCGYVKSLLDAAGEVRRSGASAIVIANSCDAMRRLYDLWVTRVPEVPAFFVDVPKQDDEDSIAFFAFELRELARRLHDDLAGKAAGDEEVEAAIRRCNAFRGSMVEVFRRQRDPRGDVSGTRVLDLCLRICRDGKSAVVREIEEIARETNECGGKSGRLRIVLAGGLFGGNELAAAIENTGARVVAIDSCIGARHYEGTVEEGSADPIRALARRRLTGPACARMHGFERRFHYLHDLAPEAAADGIIFHTVKFCDGFLYDVPLLRDRFKQIGLPFLWLENDYGTFDAAYNGMRIEAFLETSCGNVG